MQEIGLPWAQNKTFPGIASESYATTHQYQSRVKKDFRRLFTYNAHHKILGEYGTCDVISKMH